MQHLSLFLALAVGAIAAPATMEIDITLQTPEYSSHARVPSSLPLHKTGDFCIPFYGHQCAVGDDKFECCAQFKCMDDGSGNKIQRCLVPEEDNIVEKKGDDDICLPPWDIAHMFCGIGEPKYKCCHSEVFACKKLDGPEGSHYGCIPKDADNEYLVSKAETKKVKKVGKKDDDDICLPPWEDGHMICGIGEPKYKCCGGDHFECKEFGRSGMYGCQPKQSAAKTMGFQQILGEL